MVGWIVVESRVALPPGSHGVDKYFLKPGIVHYEIFVEIKVIGFQNWDVRYRIRNGA
jgi:hypothetical protein